MVDLARDQSGSVSFEVEGRFSSDCPVTEDLRARVEQRGEGSIFLMTRHVPPFGWPAKPGPFHGVTLTGAPVEIRVITSPILSPNGEHYFICEFCKIGQLAPSPDIELEVTNLFGFGWHEPPNADLQVSAGGQIFKIEIRALDEFRDRAFLIQKYGGTTTTARLRIANADHSMGAMPEHHQGDICRALSLVHGRDVEAIRGYIGSGGSTSPSAIVLWNRKVNSYSSSSLCVEGSRREK